MRIVIVTGSRDHRDPYPIFHVLYEAHRVQPIDLVVQGGAKGADAFALEWAEWLGVRCVTVKAEWSLYGKAAGMKRNRKMLDMYPQAEVFAFPKGDSPGTRGCIAEAQKRNMRVYVTETK
jgi:hypothetical protein